jgi:hypothetical protein
MTYLEGRCDVLRRNCFLGIFFANLIGFGRNEGDKFWKKKTTSEVSNPIFRLKRFV